MIWGTNDNNYGHIKILKEHNYGYKVIELK